MLRFTWTYDHARGGAVVSVASSEGEVTELGSVNNGNVAQALCDALAKATRDVGDEPALHLLGYVNPPRPAMAR